MATHELVVQEWMSRDSWSGPESEGYILHLTLEEAKAASKKHWDEEKARNPSGVAPEFYICESGAPYTAPVSKKLYNYVVKKKAVRIFPTEGLKLKNQDGRILEFQVSESGWKRLTKSKKKTAKKSTSKKKTAKKKAKA